MQWKETAVIVKIKSWKRVLIAAMALVAISMIVAACGSSGGTTSSSETTAEAETTTPSTETEEAPETEETATSEPSEGVATNWELPNATQTETRDVASEIEASNVSELGVAWSSPIVGNGSFGGWATTPVVVEGVVYAQDLESNVYAIDYKTGKVLWIKKYNSGNTGPDGVTVSEGTVYGATAENAFALNAETGEQLWTKKLIRNANEGIDMAPGINEGTVYVSTVPGNNNGFYKGNGKAILWAMDAKTGATKWKWDEVENLWGNPKVNSGGGQWEPPAFDAEGNVYLNVANPAPFPGNPPTGKPKEPWGSSRPGPDKYTDSVVKLNKDTGKMEWYYQLTPHDIQDHDLNNAPVITEGAEGEQIVVSAGKGGIVFAVSAETGKKLWETPVGVHNGHDKDNLYAMRHEYNKLPKPGTPYNVEPGEFGGVESPLASDGKMTYMAIVDWPTNFTTQSFETLATATGEMVAVDNATGKIVWDHKFPQAAYGAATVSNDLVWTTTFDGKLWALNTETGEVVWSTQLSAGTNSPISINEDTVLTGAGYASGKGQEPLIVAYKLGATGKLPSEEKAAAGKPKGGEEKSEGGGATASVAKGEEVFGTTCATCHTLAAAGSSGTVGPNLDELEPSKALVVKQVTNGGGGMPAFGSALSKEEIESVAEFVSGAAGKPLTAEQEKKAEENGGGGGAP
jgi:outer membrane protein assembly factor BamB